MKLRKSRALISVLGVGTMMAGSLTVISMGTSPAATATAPHPVPGDAAATLAPGTHIASSGAVNVVPMGQVNMAALPNVAATPSGTAQDKSPLYINGTRNQPAVARTAAKAKPGAAVAVPLVSTPTKVISSFAGTDFTQSSCGCEPPDSNGAMNKTEILEATNLALTTWKKAPGTTGSLVRRVAIATFLNTTDALADPRVFYDNAWQRFVFTVTVVPASATATPAEWVAASATTNADGTWHLYRLGLPTAAGSLQDYPMVGMDADSMVISTNTFAWGSGGAASGGFTGGLLYSLPKQRIYNGLGFFTPVFSVDFSSHPAFVEGIPQYQDGKEYVVASQLPYGGTGFDVYYLTNSDRPDSEALTYQGAATDSNGTTSPPPASQPGTGNPTLATLDGRLQAAPHQLNGNLWFARTEAIGGGTFPAVEYGTIAESNLAVTSNVAFDSATSDDWNPSIAVSDAGSGTQYVFLNWAYTDPTNGVNTSTRVAGLGPADGIQLLDGVGTTLATGGLTTTETSFGTYSSVQIDPIGTATCPAGRRALIENEEFDSVGNWQMRDAWVGFC